MKNIIKTTIRFFVIFIFFPCAKVWIRLFSKKYYTIDSLLIYTPLCPKGHYQIIIDDLRSIIDKQDFKDETSLIKKKINSIVLLKDEIVLAPAWIVGKTVFMESSGYNNKFGLFLFLIYYTFPLNKKNGIFATLDKLSNVFSTAEYTSLWTYWREYFASFIKEEKQDNRNSE